MPPKRKSRRESGAAPVKKAKVEKVEEERSTLEADAVDWQLEDRPNVWMSFASSIQEEIVQAYNDGFVQCEIEGGEFAILFEKPCRKTVKTGYMKRVRIAIKDTTDDSYYVWGWTDGRKKRFYDVESTLRLEENQTSDSLDLMTEGKPCDVSPKDLLHENKYTMHREVSDAAAAPDPAADGAGDAAPARKASKAASKMADSIAKSKAAKAEVKEEVIEKKVVFTGKAPVDPEYEKAERVDVYYDPSCVWDCMLNQTNLQNNNNKYYLIQLLKDKTSNVHSVWMRWGRVGKRGQTSLFPCGPDLEEAKRIFSQKFKDKTKNDWADRDSFSKVSGKYDLVAIDYAADSETAKDVVDASKKPAKVPDSKLDTRLRTLIELICNVKAMERALIEMKYDAKKSPLGKLTKAQIKAGYEALQQIEGLIKKGQLGFALTEACNAFYTRIPHDFGMRVPDKINTLELMQKKLQLLETLDDIEVAVNILKTTGVDAHPVDQQYLALKCQLRALEKPDPTYKMLESYLLTNVGSTHNLYDLNLLDVFECQKTGESPPKLHNRMLLWHGSRLTNWAGILATGLRIAPREAPVTGYMFGKGVYFADCSTKSANYCFPTQSNSTGMLVLCEVGLGDPNELKTAKYDADQLPAGKHSTKGCGRYVPKSSSHVTLEDGVVVPIGKIGDDGVSGSLLYNEYIVYNTAQVRMRYLLKVQFKYN